MIGAENLRMVLLQTTFCPLYAAYLEWYYWRRLGPRLNTEEPSIGVLVGRKEYSRMLRQRSHRRENKEELRLLSREYLAKNREQVTLLFKFAACRIIVNN